MDGKENAILEKYIFIFYLILYNFQSIMFLYEAANKLNTSVCFIIYVKHY